MLELGKCFGNVVGHDRADPDGITKIANNGGDSILVSSNSIYDHIAKVNPDGLEKLKQEGVIRIKRGESEA